MYNPIPLSKVRLDIYISQDLSYFVNFCFLGGAEGGRSFKELDAIATNPEKNASTPVHDACVGASETLAKLLNFMV